MAYCLLLTLITYSYSQNCISYAHIYRNEENCIYKIMIFTLENKLYLTKAFVANLTKFMWLRWNASHY